MSSHDARLLPIADRVVEMAPTPPGTDRHTGTCQFHAGETIFEQGERAEFVYEIVSGEVDIVRVLTNGGEERLARMGAGRYFGELGPLLGFPRSATARAATEVTAVSYGVREFRSLIHGDASTR